MRVIPWEESLNSKQLSLLVGSLLGDARLECRSVQGTARLRIHHSDAQRDYLFWKYSLLKPLVNKQPWKTDWIDKRNGKVYTSWFFHTRTAAVFGQWWKLFYVNGRKILPVLFGQYLDPLALAIWFLDDGCFQPNCIILNTQSFSLDENNKLRKYFSEQFGVDCGIQHDRNNVRLYFGKLAREKLLTIIRPYILEIFPVTTDPTVASGGRGEIAGARYTG